MDVDPLSDHPPPRYAVESDDEEDEFNPLSTLPARSMHPPVPNIQVSTDRPISLGRHLVVSSGAVGAYWARGADLGEQVGTVRVDEVQIGTVFTPAYTDTTVLLSELDARLPIWAMHAYATSVLSAFHPSSLSLLDTYPLPTYISPTPISPTSPPTLYLTTASPSPGFLKTIATIQPYSPPNLVSTTAAAFVLTSTRLHESRSIPSLLLLLPSRTTPPPFPRDLDSIPSFDTTDDLYWPPSALQDVHCLLLSPTTSTPVNVTWKPSLDSKSTFGSRAPQRRRRGSVGDGGMYI